MMSPIQLHCERTSVVAAFSLTPFTCAHCIIYGHFPFCGRLAFFCCCCVRVKLALHFWMRHICPFEWKRPERRPRGEASYHTPAMPETLSFLSFCVILIQSVGCAGKILQNWAHTWVAKGTFIAQWWLLCWSVGLSVEKDFISASELRLLPLKFAFLMYICCIMT
jgi:hypothetical protein